MKKQRKQRHQLNHVAIFTAFAVVGCVLLVTLINVLGLDYWNWPVVQSTNMAVIETAENLETGAMANILFLAILMIVGMPVVATAAIDLYFGPK